MSKPFYIIYLLSIQLLFTLFLSAQNTIGLLSFDPDKAYEGFNLIFPHNQPNVYLLDNCGQIVHSWEDEEIYRPGNTVYLLENGHLLKCKRNNIPINDPIWAGGGGAFVEIRDWDNQLLWSFEQNNDTARLHHDIALLPNGNIVMISWELRTFEEAIQAGRKPELMAQQKLWPEYLLEVNPQTNEVVWEWYTWDHLIQDVDATKDNFGVVADHPELVDINWDLNDGHPDWMHANALAYNPVLDQLILSVPYFHEVWIIDHSTTTEEAASHEGGNSGKGGDLLYRWGNPQSYQRGSAEDQQLFFSHYIHWIKPDATAGDEDFGKLAVFNNRVGEDYSTANIFTATYNMEEKAYLLENGVFGPTGFDRVIKHPLDSTALYSTGLSSVQFLPNGNALILSSRWGYALEVTQEDEMVWEYRIPFQFGKPAAQGTVLSINNNITFHLTRFAPNYPAFEGRDLSPQAYLEREPNENFCRQILPISGSLSEEISIFPNPVNDFLYIKTDQAINKRMRIFDALGQEVYRESSFDSARRINTSDWKPGLYVVKLEGFVAKKVLLNH